MVINEKVYPLINWSNPADIEYGTPLSSTQLNATVGIPGTFQYDTPAGTVLGSGSQQLLSVTFYPEDTLNYYEAVKTVLIDIIVTDGIAGFSGNEVRIYPVPVSDRLVLNHLSSLGSEKTMLVQIITMDGRIIKKASLVIEGDTHQIDVRGIPRGVYMLSLVAGRKTVMRKFVKE
jgi:hypothetical protein